MFNNSLTGLLGTTSASSKLSLSKIVAGISKALSVANKAIPLYQQVKPVFSNAKPLLNLVKSISKINSSSPVSKNTNVSQSSDSIKLDNNPVFFQ